MFRRPYSRSQRDVQRECAQGSIPGTRRQTAMKLLERLRSTARRLREAPRSLYYVLYRKLRRPLPGEYQTYSYTRPDRYPWLFEFAARRLGAQRPLSILSLAAPAAM